MLEPQMEKRRWSEVHAPLPSGGMSDVRSLEQDHRNLDWRRREDHEGINRLALQFSEKRLRTEDVAINQTIRVIS
jgi:hypothetical protein